MAEQQFGSEFAEKCENCNDPLIADQNWAIGDIRTNLQYCTKPECQEVKPVLIKNQMTGSSSTKKPRVIDRGLQQNLKETRRFTRVKPDEEKVNEFAKYIADPTMKNGKGWPRYSKVFTGYGINEFVKGFTCNEMAVPQFPDEVDDNGCPSVAAVAAVKRYLKSLTRRFHGNLEIYATKGVSPKPPYRRELRWHVLKNREELDKQTEAMREIAKNIELAAKAREVNFASKTYDQRMEKVELLDRFFDST